MATKNPDLDRRLVPRWRQSQDAASSGELRSAQLKKSSQTTRPKVPQFDELKEEFSARPRIELAADLVSCSIALGRTEDDDVKRAAEFLLTRNTSTELRRLCTRTLEGTIGVPDAASVPSFNADDLRANLHADLVVLKRRVRGYPKNALAWVDIARLQTSLGNQVSARRAIGIALSLAPENRFVLRSTARFFVHADHKNREENLAQGLRLLRRSSLIKLDPWIMAAEISLSEIHGQTPRSLKFARRMVKEDAFHPWDLSELNGALATFAAEGGGIGQPQKFFNDSLREPTENALAQAQWASDKLRNLSIDDRLFLSTREQPFEALALKHRAARNWMAAIEECRKWSATEPMSRRPLILGSFIAAVALADGDIAREFSERALVLAPGEPWAHNNLAVALAYSGDIEGAKLHSEIYLEHALPEESLPFYYATLGLIAYRAGDRDRGLNLYLKAAQSTFAAKDFYIRSMIFWHLLREENRIGVPGTEEVANKLWPSARRLNVPELDAMYQGITKPSLSGVAQAFKNKLTSTHLNSSLLTIRDAQNALNNLIDKGKN